MSDTLPVLENLVKSLYEEDPDTPDHIFLKMLTLARTLDEEPGSVYAVLLVAIKELTHALEIMRSAVHDVHDDLDWLDENLSTVYPAWYLKED